MPFDLSKLGYWLHTSEKYMVGFLGIAIWDSLATLRTEYRLIWKDGRWSPAKIAFIVNKYWTILSVAAVIPMVYGTVSNSMCNRIFRLLAVAVTFSTLVCDVIVGIRVYGLYECKKYMLILLSILVLAEAGMMIHTVTLLIPLSLPPILGDAFDYHGCTPINPVKNEKLNAILYWAPSLFYNLLCLLLLVGRHVYLARKYTSSDLLKRLTRDGVFYFCVIVAVDVTSLYFSAQNNPGLTNINVYTSSILKSLMCTRLLLGLRGRAEANNLARKAQQRRVSAPLAPWIPPHLLPDQGIASEMEGGGNTVSTSSRIPLRLVETRGI
ncbi:hypothetical protein JCM5350_000246 [Sporobolomyces pararoseus]